MQAKTSRFNKIPLPLIGLTILAYFWFVLLMFSNSASAAVSGARSNIFPDVSPAGQSGVVRAIVQITPDGNLLRARTTIASIYVPKTAVDNAPGQSLSVSLTIEGGCDSGFWAYTDINSGLGNTYYTVYKATSYPNALPNSQANLTPVATADSDTYCNAIPYNSRGEVPMSFLATPPPVSPSVNIDEFRTHGDDGTAYYVYKFFANAWAANENNQYQNNFRVRVNTAGSYVGVAGWVGICASGSFPKSCPRIRPQGFTDILGRNLNGLSLVYSSFYGSTNPYGVEIGIFSTCPDRKGAISIYDLDIPNVSQPNMSMNLKRQGVTSYEIPYIAIDRWREGIFGLVNAHPGFGSENDEWMDMPSTDPDLQAMSNFEEGVHYSIGINGVSGTNAIQFLTEITTCPVPPLIAYVDSCILRGSETVLFGWAYDNNSTNSNDPRVRINVSGQPDQTVTSERDYRSAQINPFLTANGFGTDARDNRYGFEAVYSGLSRGTTHSVSGTALNVGAGPNQPVRINGGAVPGGGVPGSSTFPNGTTIPDACKPASGPSGTITVTCSPSGGAITVSVNASNSSGGNVGVTLTVNHSGGPTTAMGIGNGAIPLNNSVFTPNFGGADSTRTVSGTVLSVATGTTVNMTPVIYSCPAVPICDIPTITVNVGEQFYITVTLRNTTLTPIPVSGPATYAISRNGVALPGGNGSGRVYNTTTLTYSDFPATIPAGGSILVRSNPPPITIPSSGSYDVRWDVPVGSGVNAGGDCGSVAGGQGAIDASVRPYVRFYGNDVVAGGGFGNCTSTTDAHVRGYGTYGSGLGNHSDYRGSAVELAVFATGDINGVLPGSQDITRTALTELSFANQPPLTAQFGGNFGEVMCADDYWAEDRTSAVDLTPFTQLDPADLTGARRVNIATLPNGTYTFTGVLHLFADNTPVPAGKRITIYNQGDTAFGRRGAPAQERLSYDTTVAWASIDQIPLIKVVTMGNMFFDDNVIQADGLFVAVPDPANASNTGEIHTCASFASGLDLTRPTFEDAQVATCSQKLVISGAFVAKRVHLLRTNGNIQNGTPAEPYTSANIAEVFRFSPEMYLALLSDGSGAGRFDSILSLPPAL